MLVSRDPKGHEIPHGSNQMPDFQLAPVLSEIFRHQAAVAVVGLVFAA